MIFLALIVNDKNASYCRKNNQNNHAYTFTNGMIWISSPFPVNTPKRRFDTHLLLFFFHKNIELHDVDVLNI